MLFKNSFPSFKDSDNMSTCSLSEENLKKSIEELMAFRDNDAKIKKDPVLEYQTSMIKFSQWLYKQKDIPEKIKVNSEYLTFGMPVSPEFAKQFDPYMERYNQRKKGGDR